MMEPYTDVKPADRPEVVKSPLTYDADITCALHKDGSWYLLPRNHCYMVAAQGSDSVVFHVCSKSWRINTKSGDDGKPIQITAPYTSHRSTPSDMTIPCIHCHEPVPKSVQTLFLLHNWNYLSVKE